MGGTRKRWSFNHLFAANSLRLRGPQDQLEKRAGGNSRGQPSLSLAAPLQFALTLVRFQPVQAQLTWRESPSLTVRSCPVLRPPDFPSREGALLLGHPCLILVTQQGRLSPRPKPSTLPGSPLTPAAPWPHTPLAPAAPLRPPSLFALTSAPTSQPELLRTFYV